MPKLLSRSKHEEFESNSSLQIRSQKERREKSEEKWSIAKFGSCSTVPSSSTVPSCCPFLLFDASDFCYIFFVSSYFNPCNSFCFGFFCNFPYTEHLYKPQSVQTFNELTSLHVGNRERQFPRSFLSPFSFIFFPLSRLLNTPLRMTTQRMVD